jgi:pSer/pThr/pTyr-binding forkhead associated (FHA) protein
MNLFLEACRSRGPLQLGVSYAGEPEILRRSFRQPFVVVGSDPTADLTLENSQVSDRHAYVQVIGGRVFCVDLGSRAGIQWGEVTGRWGWVHPRQGIRVGGCHLHLLEANQEQAAAVSPANPLAAPGPAGDCLPGVSLELLTGPAPEKTWRMNRTLALVGRAPECKVHVVAARVSRFHCSLLRTPQGVWVVDLLGKAGTFVNDQPVRWAYLEEGDEVRVGAVVIRCRYETPPPASPQNTVPSTSLSGQQLSDVTGEGGRSLVPLGQPWPAGALTVGPPSLEFASASSLRKAGVADSILIPLVEQFSAMQQQMFSQFQQSMVMLFQMFHTTQKEQMGQIREELDRLHDITRELTALQSELIKQNLTAPKSEVPLAGVIPSVGQAFQPDRQAGKPDLQAAVNGGLPAGEQEPAPSPAPEDKESAPPAKRTPPAPTAGQGPPAGAGQSQDIHAWLTQRIAGLEKERQGRWQKILNFLRGK